MLYANYVRNKMRHLYKPIIAEAEGVPCVLEYSKGKYMKDYEIYGNSVQNGTPSPENPVQIQSVGDLVTDEASEHYGKYDIAITVAGKNLIPYPYIYTTTTINGVTFTDNGDGSITVDGTAAATANAVFYLADTSSKYTLDKCGLKIGDSYTISKTLISGDSIANVYFTANYYNTSGTMKAGAVASSANTAAATIQSDFKSWGIYLLVLKDKTVNNITIKLQLEKGSSVTEYEPYRGIETTHIYLDEPLRKVGDYSDYVDFKKQKVVRNIKEIIFDGTENWGYRDTDNIIYLSINNLASSVYCYSTHFLSEALKDTISPYFRPVTGVLRLYQRSNNTVYSSADEFKAFLENQNTAGTPLIVDCILSTPIEESISLPPLQTFKDTNIISVDTTELPSNIKVTYVRT